MSANRFLSIAVVLGLIGVLTEAQQPSSDAEPPQLKCDSGPLTRTFGKTPWYVYACDDGHSVAVVTAPGNPAMPFYFFFVWNSKGFDLRGEGTGNKEITDAAFEDLKALTDNDIAQLHKDAASVKSGDS
jgi:hypothetical protein